MIPARKVYGANGTFLFEIVVWVLLVFFPVLEVSHEDILLGRIDRQIGSLSPVQNDLTGLLRVLHTALLFRLTHQGPVEQLQKHYIDGLFVQARSLLTDIDSHRALLTPGSLSLLENLTMRVDALRLELLLPAPVGDLPREAMQVDLLSLRFSYKLTETVKQLIHVRRILFGKKRYWQILELLVFCLIIFRFLLIALSKRREEGIYLRWASERTSDFVIILAPDGTIRYVNPALVRYLVAGKERKPGKKISRQLEKSLSGQSIFPLSGSFPLFSRIAVQWKSLIREGSVRNVDFPFTGEDSILRWFSLRMTEISDEFLGVRGYECRFVDITSLKKSEGELASQKEWLRITMNSIGDGVLAMDIAGHITFINRMAAFLIGIEEKDALGKEISEVLTIVQEEGRDRVELPLSRILREDVIASIPGNVAIKSSAGELIPISDSLAPIHNHLGEIVGSIFVFQESTQRRQAQEALWNMKYHDQLTGLPNDRLFRERLASFISLYPETGKGLCIFAVGIDHFKKINDTYGHVLGNTFLEQFASRLSKVVSPEDSLARLGGDEFLVLMSDFFDPESISEKARLILMEMRKPFLLGEHKVSMTVSIGVSVFPDDGKTEDLLIRNADIALNSVKDRGRNDFRFYSPMMNPNSQEEIELREDLQDALRDESLELYYQPKVNAKTGEIVGFESLIRWNHPQKGMLLPHQFIRMAEEQGLIVGLGEWVLRSATRDGKILSERWSQVSISVNVSVRQLVEPDFYEHVRRALLISGLNPGLLILEVTESIFAREIAEIEMNVQKIKEMGVKLSLDDFGTGFSSLGNLTRFSPDEIKVDKSFVDQMMSGG
jgi:diguanylate cyclase (GGDEF)-like protein/PAS domain S-box-containing protein